MIKTSSLSLCTYFPHSWTNSANLENKTKPKHLSARRRKVLFPFYISWEVKLKFAYLNKHIQLSSFFFFLYHILNDVIIVCTRKYKNSTRLKSLCLNCKAKRNKLNPLFSYLKIYSHKHLHNDFHYRSLSV